MKFLALSALILLSANDVIAQQSIVGNWTSYKVIGRPCTDYIENLSYTFRTDNTYDIRSIMKRSSGLSDERATGSYEIAGSTITGKVKNVTLGPFQYRFEDDNLVISERSCDIYLRRSDEEW
ncbi:MAG: hypothetical protein H6619_02610 [Deltaproteobacteria bacterium]|nr:hypothetical protein [Deltaproteobacteria bacterium]